MKLRFTIVLLLLSSCLLSCNSEPSVTASPTAPSSQDTPISTTYPSAPVTIPVEWPPFTGEATSQLPVTTSMPMNEDPPAGYGWGKAFACFMRAEQLLEDGWYCAVPEQGGSVDLPIRVGHMITVFNGTLDDHYETMKLEFLVNEAPLAGLVSDEQCTVADFWSNPKYMIHPFERAPYSAAASVTVTLHTDILPEEDGEICFYYQGSPNHNSDSNTLYFGRRGGVLILTFSEAEGAIDAAYQQYLQSNPQ